MTIGADELDDLGVELRRDSYDEPLTLQPRALSETERADIQRDLLVAARVLPLIDALTALVAEQAAQAFLDGQRIAEMEAERRKLNTIFDAEGDALDASESKLAAANALLRKYRVHFAAPGDSVFARAAVEDIDAHLAGQVAAPVDAEPTNPVCVFCGNGNEVCSCL